jgi:hypothetical protein
MGNLEEFMEFKDEFRYKGDSYQILHCEKDNLFSPVINEWILAQQGTYGDEIEVFWLDDYELKLCCNDKLADKENELCLAVPYSGGMILVKDFVKDYGNPGEYPCYCYKKVQELIFDQGRLVTSIDHSKAMIRIRKNIEKGLRDIRNKRDFRCIQKFIKDSFVQNYSNPMQKKRWNIILDKLKRT